MSNKFRDSAQQKEDVEQTSRFFSAYLPERRTDSLSVIIKTQQRKEPYYESVRGIYRSPGNPRPFNQRIARSQPSLLFVQNQEWLSSENGVRK